MMSNVKINFNAGPAALPPEVLSQMSEAVLSYKDTGMSILELPHRGAEFLDIVEESKRLVKELCGLNDDYEVLWLHGGGRMQFAMIPMNFLSDGGTAGYIDSGHWAAEAIQYASYYGAINVLASSQNVQYAHLPVLPDPMPEGLKYVHYTTNNTIFGTQWHHMPEVDAPLVADMSSDIFCCKRDYSRYALFYAAAQKNLGTPGVALVVVHKSALEKMANFLPPMLCYKSQAQENSILNTANVSGVYTSLLMLRWTKQKGLENLEAENRQKAKLLYDTIDNSSLFLPHVTNKADRSIMNVCFTAKDEETERAFLTLCDQKGIFGVKGHRLVGGFRVSLYNAIPLKWVEYLVDIMREFETKA